MRVRARAAGDHPTLVMMAQIVHDLDGYPPYLPDGDFDRFLFGHESLGSWVAEVDGEIAGHVALHPHSSPGVMKLASTSLGQPDDRLGVVSRLLVTPPRRRGGVAGALLEHAAVQAQSRGLFPILDVAADLVPARRLYEAAGWECAGEIEAILSNGLTLRELIYLAPPDRRPLISS